MRTVLTVKLEAESEDELTSTFPGEVETSRTHFEMLRTEGVFGPPETVELRYLIIGSKVRGAKQSDPARN